MHDACAPLREAAPAAAWVAPDRLHLTVKFLGEQSEDAVEALRAAVAATTTRHQAIPIRVGRVGAFPNFRRPRVVWMGVDGGGRLELLQHDVEIACAGLGYEPEGRAFRPHVTVARVRGELASEAARALARAARGVAFRDDATVESIDLMASELSREGSRYTLVASARLGS